MEKQAKLSLNFLRETIVKRFLFALLTIAALSGAILVTHSGPAAARDKGGGGGGDKCGIYDC